MAAPAKKRKCSGKFSNDRIRLFGDSLLNQSWVSSMLGIFSVHGMWTFWRLACTTLTAAKWPMRAMTRSRTNAGTPWTSSTCGKCTQKHATAFMQTWLLHTCNACSTLTAAPMRTLNWWDAEIGQISHTYSVIAMHILWSFAHCNYKLCFTVDAILYSGAVLYSRMSMCSLGRCSYLHLHCMCLK